MAKEEKADREGKEMAEGPEEGARKPVVRLVAARVKLLFIDRCYGSIPRSQEIIQKWVGSKGEIPEESLNEKLEALGETGEEVLERVSCGFRTSKIGGKSAIGMRDFQVQALIGYAASSIGWTKQFRGLRPVLREALTIRPRFIPFTNGEGVPIEAPHGYEDFTGHVTTPAGRRSILKRADYVENVVLSFVVTWVPGILSVGMLEQILHFGGKFQGLGSQRRFSAGEFQLVTFEKLPTPELTAI